jgi:hypothetical protein
MNKFLIIIICVGTIGCSERTLTEEMWKTDSYYYKISKSGMSTQQLNEFQKTVDGYKVIEKDSEFYIKKNWIQQYGEITGKSLATPVVVSLDVTKIVVVATIADPRALEFVLQVAISAATK